MTAGVWVFRPIRAGVRAARATVALDALVGDRVSCLKNFRALDSFDTSVFGGEGCHFFLYTSFNAIQPDQAIKQLIARHTKILSLELLCDK